METEFPSLKSEIIEKIKTLPAHGWIQYKGTSLCMDVHCKCGSLTHVDGDFVYFVKCGDCGTVYEVSGFVELTEVKELGEFEPHITN